MMMIGDPAPLRARSGRNPGRGGRVRRPETPKLVAAKRGNDETAGPSTPCNWSTPSSAQGPRRVPRSATPDHASVSILPVCQKRISRSAPVRSRSPPRFSGRMPGCRRTGERKTGEGTRCRRIRFTPPPMRITRRTLGLLYILARCFSLHALASPSRRSQPRGSAHVTSAPGAFGPVGRRATTGTGTRAGARALCGLARTDKQHKRRARRAHYQSIEASFYA